MEDEELEQELSEDELKELAKIVGSANVPDEKSTVHTFLTNVVKHPDNTKIANLTDEELGQAKFPVRTLQELALFCDEIANMKAFGEYFKKEAQITLATSLSRDAKLIEAAITTSRQIGEIPRKKPKENKGWFKKKTKE